MERSLMPDGITGDSTSIRVLPIVMPEVVLGLWSDRAICVGEDPNLFFPSYGDPGIGARRVCAGCPVRLDCIEYAVDADEFGIWGGLDQEQRRNLLHERPESA
jgi:WhiB family transcriptional regulator, redox-sensing transcriptional regulator